MARMWSLLVFLFMPWTCLAGPLIEPASTELDDNDGCSDLRIERCSQELIVFSVNETLPLDADEIDESCKRHKTDLMCIQEFYDRDCVHGIAKAVFKASKEGIADEADGKCLKDSPRRKEYDQYVPCINKAGHKIRECQRQMIGQLEAIGAHTVKKERIPYGCCRFDQFLKCVRDAIGGECSSEHVTYGESFVHSMSGNVLATACATYEYGTSSCNGLRELPLEEPKSKTFIAPLFKVLGPLG